MLRFISRRVLVVWAACIRGRLNQRWLCCFVLALDPPDGVLEAVPDDARQGWIGGPLRCLSSVEFLKFGRALGSLNESPRHTACKANYRPRPGAQEHKLKFFTRHRPDHATFEGRDRVRSDGLMTSLRTPDDAAAH
jgi:hypothetical protein